jgi:site-specific DNA recombinase
MAVRNREMMNTPRIYRIAIYIRVSTDMQVQEGYSLDAQKERLKNFCASQEGWEHLTWYVDEGASAKDLERPEMQRMLVDIDNRLVDIVLVYKLDRLTRSVKDLHKLLDIFERNNVKFRSASEVYDTTTAMGKLFITIVAALAEWERENLAERVRYGMEELVRQGKWHGGPVPEGFRWEDEVMSIVPEEAAILRELRRLYMAGNGFGATSKELNTRGLFRRGGKPWSANGVYYVLDNPFYAGKLRYGTKKPNGKYAARKKENMVDVIWSDTNFPTIFTWEEYLEHKERMRRREFYGTSKKREYWFSGVLRCARCGAAMMGRPYRNRLTDGTMGVSHINYICSNRSQQKGCHLPLFRQSVAETMIMEHLRQIKLSHDEIASANASLERTMIDYTNELDTLKRELNATLERRKKWQYMFAEDLISESDFRARKSEEDEKESVIKNRMNELQAVEIGIDKGDINVVLDLPDLWEMLDDSEKKETMQTIFESIYVDCDVDNGKKISGKGRALPFRIVGVNFN